MSAFEKLLFSLFPQWLLNGTPWVRIWEAKRAQDFLVSSRVAYVLLAAAYVLHYYFVDTPLGLTSDPCWAWYRFGLSGACILGFALSVSKLARNHRLMLGYFLGLGLAVSYLQALSTTWFEAVPYFWGILLAAAFSMFSLTSVVPGAIYLGVELAVQWDPLMRSHNNPNLIFGAYLVAVFMTIYFKSNQKHQIQTFIGDQKRLELQTQIIEAQKELNEQIQAFLPKLIKERLIHQIAANKVGVIDAIDDVLRSKNCHIAALFSDIRGYTTRSKNGDYLQNSAVPNMKMVTAIVEENRGIPRQIGDLVFAYYDDDSMHVNAKMAFQSAAEIIDMNARRNLTLPESMKVVRHVLLDCGPATVGNIGGLNSAREITAMGNCVNRLSRIDLLTKDERVASLIGRNSILMSVEFAEKVAGLFSALKFGRLSLRDLSLSIKDFPEEKELVYFRLEDQDFAISSDNSQGEVA